MLLLTAFYPRNLFCLILYNYCLFKQANLLIALSNEVAKWLVSLHSKTIVISSILCSKQCTSQKVMYAGGGCVNVIGGMCTES